ncbi:type II toxin-antitoxin system RelE/ParE family toxin [Sinorhizobium meliloti]|nr:type II toxin-antitoxin system RelE/ParE family toxin [Sinorhizobium meliloti]RVP95473.1 type II toxin-antitoxin system RelE/ParE family toxin [Sinorhizobium meliloti]
MHYSAVHYGGGVQIYKTKIFARFVRKENVSDANLVEAMRRANQGLIDADLGGGLIKQRVARPGQGRSGGYRTILLFRAGELAIFLAGFAKSERANITEDDLEDLKTIAKQWFTDPKRVEKDLAAGILNEVRHDNEG